MQCSVISYQSFDSGIPNQSPMQVVKALNKSWKPQGQHRDSIRDKELTLRAVATVVGPSLHDNARLPLGAREMCVGIALFSRHQSRQVNSTSSDKGQVLLRKKLNFSSSEIYF